MISTLIRKNIQRTVVAVLLSTSFVGVAIADELHSYECHSKPDALKYLSSLVSESFPIVIRFQKHPGDTGLSGASDKLGREEAKMFIESRYAGGKDERLVLVIEDSGNHKPGTYVPKRNQDSSR